MTETKIKAERYSTDIIELSKFLKAVSHPARLTILQYLVETKTCISGDISDYLPLSRTTVSQHLNELKDLGLIHGTIDGLKVNYCLCPSTILKYKDLFEEFFKNMSNTDFDCGNNCD